MLAAFRGEWVRSCPTAEAGQGVENDRQQQMSGSHPPPQKGWGSSCYHQISLRSASALRPHLTLPPWPLESAGGLPKLQDPETRGGSTGTVKGF